MSPSAWWMPGRATGASRSTFASRATKARCGISRPSPAGAAAAKALSFERVAAKDWVGESLAGLKPVAAGRFIVHGAHDRAGIPRQPHRHRDRSRACLRHRPSRHHARLPAGARPHVQVVGRAATRAAHSRSRHRHRRARHCRRPRAAPARAGDRHRRQRRSASRAPTPGSTAPAPLVEVVKADGVTAPSIRAARAVRSRLRQYSARTAAAHRSAAAED